MKRTEHLRWYHVFLLPLAVILLPVFLWVWLCDLLSLPKRKKEYRKSFYYRDFGKPYCRGILYSPAYRFYNSAKERSLPVKYVGQDGEAFVYENRLYLIPKFEQLLFDEEKKIWNVDYDGDHKPLKDEYRKVCTSLRSEWGAPVVLVERNMIPMEDLRGMELPEEIFLTWSYDRAFEDENSPLKLRIPRSTEDLYEMLEQTPKLCKNYRISSDGTLSWDLYDGFRVEIAVDPRDSCVILERKLLGNLWCTLTHWHPCLFEVYREARDMGRMGNVLVLRRSFGSSAVLYMGSKEKCPYKKDKKSLFGKLYYLEVKE